MGSSAQHRLEEPKCPRCGGGGRDVVIDGRGERAFDVCSSCDGRGKVTISVYARVVHELAREGKEPKS